MTSVLMSDSAGYLGRIKGQVGDFQISLPYLAGVWAVVSRVVELFRNAFSCQLEPVAFGSF